MLLFSKEAYRRRIPHGGMNERELDDLDGLPVIGGVAEWTDEKGAWHAKELAREWCEELGPLGMETILFLVKQRDEARRMLEQLSAESARMRQALQRAAVAQSNGT